MSDDAGDLRSEALAEAWRQIDDLVDEIAKLSRTALPAVEFYTELLDRVVCGMAAVGGIVWTRVLDGRLHPTCKNGPVPDGLAAGSDGPTSHIRLLETVLQSGKSRDAPPYSGHGEGDQGANPTEFHLILAPWTVDGVPAGVIEIFQRAGASPGAVRGYLHLLEVLGELVADFHRTHQLHNFRQQASESEQIRLFAERVHGSVELRDAAYAVVNEGRRLVGCDRLSVLIRRGVGYRLAAVSGVDTVDRRANITRRLEGLSVAVATTDKPLWYPEATENRSPEVDEIVDACLGESQARAIAVLPLKALESGDDVRQPCPIGVLIAEQFHGTFDGRSRRLLVAMCSPSAQAIRNALEIERIPLMRFVWRHRRLLHARPLRTTALAVLLLLVALIVLAVFPVDFTIEARGELQPVRLRDVFAVTDGVVKDLRVEHGEQVEAGQVLLLLRKPELDLEFKRVWGEMQTARKRLASVEAERIQNQRESDEQRRRYGQLTAQVEEAQELLRGLEQQYAILEQRRSELAIRSPMRGKVLTWNLKQLLEARPVLRGQVMMSVADLDGPWRLELRIPDRRIAHVLAAQKETVDNLPVSFVLATDPARKLEGEIDQVGMRTEVAETEDAFVLTMVRIDRDQVPQLILGAAVMAKIHCGKRSIGYVWLHEFVDTIRSWCLF